MAKRKRIFGENIEPACVYCKNGRPAPDNVMILCRKYGPVSPSFSCRIFSYNPIKRKIPRRPDLPDFNSEDFKL